MRHAASMSWYHGCWWPRDEKKTGHQQLWFLSNNPEISQFKYHKNYLIEAEWRIYASLNWVIIGSDNGLSIVRRQAIIWTNAGILLIGPLGTKFTEISIGIQNFHSRNCIWKRHLQNGVILSRPQWVKDILEWIYTRVAIRCLLLSWVMTIHVPYSAAGCHDPVSYIIKHVMK